MFITGGISAFAMSMDNYQKYELAFYQKVIDKKLKLVNIICKFRKNVYQCYHLELFLGGIYVFILTYFDLSGFLFYGEL